MENMARAKAPGRAEFPRSTPHPVTVLMPAVRDVQGIIARTVRLARAMGRDQNTQCQAAAHAVMAVRPDLSLRQALDAVFRLQELGAV